jgi:predicted amidophosphoribosyltransferase
MDTPACPRCAQSVAPFGVQDGTCAQCRGLGSPLECVVRAGPYRERFALALRRFKFGGQEDLDRFFSDALIERLRARDWIGSLDAVTAVPTCWRHALTRRHYVPLVIARRVASSLRVPLEPLLRRRFGPHQLGLTRSERPQNVRGVFRIVPRTQLAGAAILLVDDVATTASTLTECARTLRRSGAAKVYGAVLARVASDAQPLADI